MRWITIDYLVPAGVLIDRLARDSDPWPGVERSDLILQVMTVDVDKLPGDGTDPEKIEAHLTEQGFPGASWRLVDPDAPRPPKGDLRMAWTRGERGRIDVDMTRGRRMKKAMLEHRAFFKMENLDREAARAKVRGNPQKEREIQERHARIQARIAQARSAVDAAGTPEELEAITIDTD